MDPPAGTVERWALELITTTSLDGKLAPPPRPDAWEHAPPARRLEHPGRPAELRPIDRPPRTPGAGALREPARRAQLLHTFFHHELQAAELMAWALLAFPDTPRAFRRGLLRICDDELRHARLYRSELERLGAKLGDHGVRDWFWERVPRVTSAQSFVAFLGIGLEGANLDHAARFGTMLRAAGDEQAARAVERVGRDEIAHVRFARRWYERWTGGLDFDTWRRALPPPISPILLRGRPLARATRRRAGMTDVFLDALEAFEPS